VLVIDDSPHVRTMFELVLDGDETFELVGAADNGHAGLEAAARLRPDAVILDQEMPEATGLAVLPRRRCRTPPS